jgi:hypothetical protein
MFVAGNLSLCERRACLLSTLHTIIFTKAVLIHTGESFYTPSCYFFQVFCKSCNAAILIVA